MSSVGCFSKWNDTLKLLYYETSKVNVDCIFTFAFDKIWLLIYQNRLYM